ncbi:Hypothetical protein PENO1_096410 [Penicillium occitanis (nom. inval.)]|nr:Hypothetical protein PENO1_096410 [Penicillium occitanis (nom. inval.)]PCG91390.1 hypothetical protein PENOC_097650 [Penicillium occitanis (nom. inval.)]
MGGFSAVANLGFSVWPASVIWNLNMPLQRRLGTMALMGLGIASFAFAIVKLISNTTLLGNPDALKLLYDGIYIGIWNSIENDFVLSAACLPAVPPVIRLFTSKIPTRKQAAPGSSVPNANARFRKLKNDSKIELTDSGQFSKTWTGENMHTTYSPVVPPHDSCVENPQPRIKLFPSSFKLETRPAISS